LAIVAAAAVVLVAPATAGGSFRGVNGDVAFISTAQEVLAAACSSSRTQLCSQGGPPIVTRRFLVRIGAGGAIHRILPVAVDFGEFRGSPDGSRIAFREGEAIIVSDLAGRHRRRVAPSGGSPAWSPDGRRLVFVMDRSVWVVGVDGRGRRRLTAGERDSRPAWSPEGRNIAFIRGVRLARTSPCAFRSDIYTIPARGGRPHRLFRPAFACGEMDALDWAPTGKRLAVAISERGKEDTAPDPRARGVVGIGLLRSDGTDLRRLQDSGDDPVFSPDGRQILFNGLQCRTPQDVGQTLCGIRSDGRGLRRVAAVRDDIFAEFPPDWLVRRG
jgi:Tol biopolymer transport system component